MKEYTTLYFIYLINITLIYLWLILIVLVIKEYLRCAEKGLMKISTHLKFLAGKTRDKYGN